MRRRMVSMNRKLRRSGLLLIFVTSLCFAGSRCADAGMRQASIGGNTIRGSVILSKKLSSSHRSGYIFHPVKRHGVERRMQTGISRQMSYPQGDIA